MIASHEHLRGAVVSRDTSLVIIQGTLDVMILKALSAGAQHGYGITAWIRERTEGELGIEDGALYQALHRLSHRGLVEAEWGVSENNRRARYYRLTRSGRRELREAQDGWRRYARAVSRVLDAPA
jgi:PadR family transcriptional regulator, regulatory protein PadR